MLDVRWLFREENHDEEWQQHHGGGEAVDVLPAEVHGEARSEEGGEGGAAVACSRDAHGEAFILLGEPAGTERERNAEAGSGDAEQDSHGEDVVGRLDEEKAVEQRDDDRRHLDDGRVFSADVLREDAEGKAHEGAGERGDGDHEADLGRGEVELFGDEGAHGAVEDPDGEGEVEVKKGRKQRWRMARFEEGFDICHGFGSLRSGILW